MLVLSPNAVFFTSEYFSGIVKQLPLIFMGLAIVGFFLLSNFASCFTNFNKCFHLIYFFIAKKLSFDLIYNSLIVKLFCFHRIFFIIYWIRFFYLFLSWVISFFCWKIVSGYFSCCIRFVYHYIFLLSFVLFCGALLVLWSCWMVGYYVLCWFRLVL